MHHFSLCMSICVATCFVMSTAEQQKRAPSGFTGVRGKKSIPDTAYSEPTETIEIAGNNMNDLGDVTYVDRRAPSGFFGMRGKKPFDGWISQEYAEDVYKRAPSGFMGLRGKKDMDYDGDYDKRAPSGFFGMRGKKFSDFQDNDIYSEKRAPSGFLGMRGKKEYDDIIDEMKRAAPENRFFGMRGKKQQGRSGFFGMRGKKYPYEFRGKFVGVRGKKATNDPCSDCYGVKDTFGDKVTLDQFLSLLTESRNYGDSQNEKADGYFERQVE